LTERQELLLHVSAGLALDGGGTAVVGRLIAATAAEFAQAADLNFRILHLGHGTPSGLPQVDIRAFHGRPGALAAAAIGAQLGGRCAGIVFDHSGPARVQALVPRLLKAPYLVMLYGIDMWGPLGWSRSRSLRSAEQLIAITRYSIDRALPDSPWLERAEVIHPVLEERPADGDCDEELIDRLGNGYLLTVGRLSPDEKYKGHRQLIAAMQKLVPLRPDARLVIVGSGDDRVALERLVADLQLDQNVIFTGFVSEATLREVYERCAAFVMPSTDEGFGLVFLEAMRASKACVAASGSAAREIIEPEVTGILVDRDDRSQIVDALNRLLGRPDDAREMGARGHRRWRQRFTTAAFKAAFTTRLERLTGRGHVRD